MDKSELELKKLEADLHNSLLESKKLNRDLDTYNERFEMEKKKVYSERNRFWAETFRLVLIVVITSGTTYLINNSTEDHKRNNEVIFDDYKSFKTDRDKFNNPLNDLTEKKRLACHMVQEYADLDYDKVKSFLTSISKLCGSTNFQASQNKINSGISASKVDSSLKKKFAIAEKSKSDIEEKLKSASAPEKKKLNADRAITVRLLDSIASLPQVSALSVQSEEVTKSVSQQTKIVNDIVKENSSSKLEDGYPQTKWFKTNYFLVIDNMKIVLEEIINDGAIRISMCRSVTSEVCPIDNQIDLSGYSSRITADKPVEINENGYKYIIRLDHTGSAGKNPFTKAAYITIEKYRN
jgi:ethanolamine utilization protein EutQ (cupin superfamily)